MTQITKTRQLPKPEEVQEGEIIEAEPQQPLQAVPTQYAVSPLDLPADVFSAALERRTTNRQALMQWVKAAMVEGTDYGRIHNVGKSKCQLAAQGRAHECTDPRHWSKASLWKPGAEKICGMLGVTVSYPTLRDYEQAALNDVEIRNIIVRCELLDANGRVVADGVGARSLAQEYGDLNKALKMAEKSAHIDATLRMAGLSEVFTQDLEDMKPKAGDPPPDPVIGKQSQQHRRIEAHIKELRLNRDGVKTWCQRRWETEHLDELTESQYLELLRQLPRMAAHKARKTQETEAENEARTEREAIQAENA